MIKINKGIFLHIPKTGGTWLSNYFRESGMIIEQSELAHINGSQIDVPNRTEVVFCFVRHPLTWLRSWWQCKQKIVKDRRGGPIDKIVDLPFKEFVDRFISDMPGHITGYFDGFTNYSHFVGKQESLREDLIAFFKSANIKYNISLLYNKKNENVIPSTAKYTVEQSLKIMEMEKGMVNRYEYNYIPTDIIEKKSQHIVKPKTISRDREEHIEKKKRMKKEKRIKKERKKRRTI